MCVCEAFVKVMQRREKERRRRHREKLHRPQPSPGDPRMLFFPLIFAYQNQTISVIFFLIVITLEHANLSVF